MKKRNLVAVVGVAALIASGVANWPLCYLFAHLPPHVWLEKPEIEIIGLLPFLAILLSLIILGCMIRRMCKNEEVLLDKEKAKIEEEYRQKRIFEQYQYELYREQRNEKQLQENRKWMFEKLNATRQELYKHLYGITEAVHHKSGMEVYPPVNFALQRFAAELDDAIWLEKELIRQLAEITQPEDLKN